MSVMVNIQTTMTSMSIVESACKRRFKNVNGTQDTVSCSVTTPRRSYGVNVSFRQDANTKNVTAHMDQDYQTEVMPLVTEAYAAEEVIRAADAEGRAWQEYRNSDQELVLEVSF